MDKITALQEELGKLQYMFYNHLGTLQRDFQTHHGKETPSNNANEILESYKNFLEAIDELPEDVDISDDTLTGIDQENRKIKEQLEEKEREMEKFREEIGSALQQLAEHSLPSNIPAPVERKLMDHNSE